MNNGTKYYSGPFMYRTGVGVVRPSRVAYLLPSSDQATCILSVYATIAQPGAVSTIRLFKPEKQFRALSRNNIARRYSRSSFVAGTRETRYAVLEAQAALTIG